LAVDERPEVIFFDFSRDVAVATDFMGKIDLLNTLVSSHDIRYGDAGIRQEGQLLFVIRPHRRAHGVFTRILQVVPMRILTASTRQRGKFRRNLPNRCGEIALRGNLWLLAIWQPSAILHS